MSSKKSDEPSKDAGNVRSSHLQRSTGTLWYVGNHNLANMTQGSDELTAVVEELLESLSTKFTTVSSEIFAKSKSLRQFVASVPTRRLLVF